MAKKVTPVTPLQPTSLEDLVKASQGVIIELPPFAEGQPFVAKLRRPSMLALIKSGKIPNSLLATANKLFADGTVDEDDPNALSSLFSVLDALCEACFVEPSYNEMKTAGVELTDDQLMFIFNYTQRGVAALDSFRSQLKYPELAAHE